jgi:hypothetical protein
MTKAEQASRCREYAEMLDNAPSHDDMGLSMALSQAADVLREASVMLFSPEPLAPPQAREEASGPHAMRSAIMRSSAMVPFCRCGRPMWHHTDPAYVGDCLEYLPDPRSPNPSVALLAARDEAQQERDAALRGVVEFGRALQEFATQVSRLTSQLNVTTMDKASWQHTASEVQAENARLTSQLEEARKDYDAAVHRSAAWKLSAEFSESSLTTLREAQREIVALNVRRDDADIQQATRDAAVAFKSAVKIAAAALSGSPLPQQTKDEETMR